MGRHPPSQCRQILRQVKEGVRDPAGLLAEAREIHDPGYAAIAVMATSGDRRLPWNEASQALALALRLANSVTNPRRRAATWAQLLEQAEEWRPGARNPQAGPARAQVRAAALVDFGTLPAGQTRLEATRILAPLVGSEGRLRLLEKALTNRGLETEGAKAVLRASNPRERRELARRLDAVGDAAVRANLLGFLASHGEASPRAPIAAAWAIEDPARRREAVRVLAYQAPDIQALDDFVTSVQGRAPIDAFHALCAAAAAADKLGDAGRCQSWLDVAEGTLAVMPEAERVKAGRKLAQARERAGQIS